MNATDKITTDRGAYNCPEWCNGGDHEPLIPGEPVEHWTSVGDFHDARKVWEVTIAQPVDVSPGGHALLQLGNYDSARSELSQCRMTSSEARSIAALLIRAADRVEMAR